MFKNLRCFPRLASFTIRNCVQYTQKAIQDEQGAGRTDCGKFLESRLRRELSQFFLGSARQNQFYKSAGLNPRKMGRYFLNASEHALLQAGRIIQITSSLSELTFVDFSSHTLKNEELVAFIPCEPHPIAPYLDPESFFTFFSRKSSASMSDDVIKATLVFAVPKSK
jgi:hypothetical protein